MDLHVAYNVCVCLLVVKCLLFFDCLFCLFVYVSLLYVNLRIIVHWWSHRGCQSYTEGRNVHVSKKCMLLFT